MNLSVLIPYRPDNGHRDRAFRWLMARYAATLPDAELIVEGDDGGADPGEFNHPLAINRAAARATGDTFLIADADTAFAPGFVHAAADIVDSGKAAWALPRYYAKMNEDASARILASSPSSTLAHPNAATAEWIGDSVSWSGLVFVSRAGFAEVGGYDERWEKWGADDAAFAITYNTLVGPVHRLEGFAFHLWHPAPLEQTYGHDRHPEQHAIGERYAAAAGDPDAVRKVRFG